MVSLAFAKLPQLSVASECGLKVTGQSLLPSHPVASWGVYCPVCPSPVHSMPFQTTTDCVNYKLPNVDTENRTQVLFKTSTCSLPLGTSSMSLLTFQSMLVGRAGHCPRGLWLYEYRGCVSAEQNEDFSTAQALPAGFSTKLLISNGHECSR